MNLSKSAMLVSVTIMNGGLLGERRDKTASALVEDTYNISHRRAKASKYLIDRRHKAVKRVVATSQRVREVVYRFTLPWGDEKLRLLPVKTAEEFRKKITEALMELEEARAEYVQEYPALVSASERDLGELFDRSQYPGPDGIRSMFTAKVSYWPIPESGHFIAEISAAASQEAKDRIEAEVEERLIEATYDMVRRAKEVVAAFIEKVEGVNVEPGVAPSIQPKLSGVIRDSLTENINDTANLIDKLNLTGNEQIKKVVLDLKRLGQYYASHWREHPMSFQRDKPIILSQANQIMVSLQMLDLKDQEIADMCADASDYMDM